MRRQNDLNERASQRWDFAGQSTEEPVVLAWMPAASPFTSTIPIRIFWSSSLCFRMEPRPDLGVLPWSKWQHRTPAAR